MSTILNICQI